MLLMMIRMNENALGIINLLRTLQKKNLAILSLVQQETKKKVERTYWLI